MSELIKYLSKFDTLEQSIESIKDDLGVRVKSYDTGLCVFNYSQIDSPKTNEVVRECRGAILKMTGNKWVYVCRPFKRFFNLDEAPNTLTNFDWGRSEAFEKADGSLIKVYLDHYDEWQIATRGTAYAESENYTGGVFGDMVLDSFGLTELEFQESCDENLPPHQTHLYEFTSPDNRVVTPYLKSEMVYLGSVRNKDGKVINNDGLIGNSRHAKKYSLSTAEECVAASKVLKGLAEGFVARDSVSGQMIKIKSPLYVAAHWLRGDCGLTSKKIAKLVVTNESSEYLKYFPEDSDKVEEVNNQWLLIQDTINVAWERNKSIEDLKSFAMLVKDLSYSACMFRAWNNDTNPVKELHLQKEKSKIDLLLKFIKSGELK